MSKSNVSILLVDALGALLTAEELAKHLKVKTSYLQWLRHRHGLPYVRVGGEVRFNPQTVSTWLSQREVPARGRLT